VFGCFSSDFVIIFLISAFQFMYTLCTVFMKNNMELVMTVFNKCQTPSDRIEMFVVFICLSVLSVCSLD